MAQGKAVAIANNDYVHVGWDFGEPLAGYGGFAVYRISEDGDAQAVPLPVFDSDADGNRVSNDCERMPIRRYNGKR